MCTAHTSPADRWFQRIPGTLLPILLLVGLLLLAFQSDAAAQPEPQRITFNTVEDRTNSGSLVEICDSELFAVWAQAQGGIGWRLMWSERLGVNWAEPQPIEAGMHADFDPRLMVYEFASMHAVWQRNTGDAAEIMLGSRPLGGSWTVEPVTTNATEDLTPDIAESDDDLLHVVWAGFDADTQSGKVFYGVRNRAGGDWTIEKLSDSELGPFWTGATPRVDVDGSGIVHVVYRGGNFGDYHVHYARREAGVWSYRILFSGNINDFVTDVTARSWDRLVIAASGNDGFGFPSRIYLWTSFDSGVNFFGPELVSGAVSTELGNVTAGTYDAVVAGSGLSGNIFTGDLWTFREFANWVPQAVPPQDQSSADPSVSEALCIARSEFHAIGVCFTNSRGHGPDSSEVYVVAGQIPGGIESSPAPIAGPLRLSAAPNPFGHATSIALDGVTGGDPVEASIYDAAGRLVRHFGRAAVTATWRWDGTDARGRRVAAGTYFIEVQGGAGRAVERVVVVR